MNNLNESPTHLDLFSGIGGFRLAAERCGFRTIGFSEVDPYASAILRKHWPDVPNFGDIRNSREWKIGRVDLLTGGFPCQPFSLAGKRRGKEDDRALWPEMLRTIESIKPAWVIAENVPGIVRMELGQVLSDLESIGYDFPRDKSGTPIVPIVPACAIGADHIRKRVWIIAHSNSSRGRIQSKSRTALKNSSGNFDDGKKGIASNSHEKGLQKLHRIRCGTSHGNARSSSIQVFRNQGAVEPCLGRNIHGVPNRVDRIKCLGNAIVPQVAEVFLKEIRKLI